jgi:hypothetical protein
VKLWSALISLRIEKTSNGLQALTISVILKTYVMEIKRLGRQEDIWICAHLEFYFMSFFIKAE